MKYRWSRRFKQGQGYVRRSEQKRISTEGKIEKSEEIRFGGVDVSSFDQLKVTIQSHWDLSEDTEQPQHDQATA